MAAQGSQQEGARAHIVGRVLRAGKTLIVDVEAVQILNSVEGIGASGPPAHQLFRDL